MDYRTLKYVPLATASTVLLPLVARAATDIPVGTGANITPFAPNNNQDATFSDLFGKVVVTFLWVATAAAIIYLLLSGFNYITAGGDQEKADTARKGIINAIIGIVIIMAAFFILNAARTAGSNAATGGQTGSIL